MDNAIRSISSVSSRYNESYVSYGKKTDELRAKKAYRESLLVVALFFVVVFCHYLGAVLLGAEEFYGFVF